jgi:hypothetical protein
VGRNKQTEITRTADRLDRAGGDYHTTFYPQPTFVSSRRTSYMPIPMGMPTLISPIPAVPT